ncbi:MAG: YggS family pyridoxal phosphate-dependent enzyme, partial [Chloroflexales bacterium]
FDMIQSVDSLRLAEALDRHAAEIGRRLPILLQVNVSGEPRKEGFALAGGVANRAAYALLSAELERAVALPQLEVRGLMTIAPIGGDPEAARPTFRMLRELRDDLARRLPQARWDELSMGMTDDFAAAIAEGATIVRVGRAIFGERPG